MTFDPSTLVNRRQLVESLLVEFDDASVAVYERKDRSTKIGASTIGDKCSRRLWYRFRWFKKDNFESKHRTHGQMLRLFNRGHREEEPVFKIMEKAGHRFFPVPEGSHRGQHTVPTFANGHGGGLIDNIGLLPERYDFHEQLIYEAKTAQDSSWKKTKKDGVKVANWQHFVQMCLYGYQLQIKYALYIVVNKNTDEVYLEFVILDWEVGKDAIAKAEIIVDASIPPQKYGMSRSYDECNWCNLVDICHDDEQPQKNCRTCQFASAEENGKWYCNNWGAEITKEGMVIGCNKWKRIG